MARVAAGAFGFLIFNHAFDGPDSYGTSSFFGRLIFFTNQLDIRGKISYTWGKQL